MRDRFTVITGVLLVAIGLLWIVDLSVGLDVPWEYVVPGSLVAFGLLLVLGRSDGGGDGKPPSQFERDDAPRVP
jgi:hypothetical protein